MCCRAEEVLPAGQEGPPNRVAVKQVENASQPGPARWVQQEDSVLRKLMGKPYMVDYQGLFQPSPSSSQRAMPDGGPGANAYLVMGYDYLRFCGLLVSLVTAYLITAWDTNACLAAV